MSTLQNDIPVVHSSFFLSEAWSDRLMTRHFSNAFLGLETGMAGDDASAIPKVIRSAGSDRAAQWISFIRLAVPANQKMPYYLSQESDRNGDGTVDQVNTGAVNGIIQGYPEQAAVGPHKETAVAIQDYWYALEGQEEYQRVRQIPVASNITGLRFEYFHEVPVYQSRVAGGRLELFAQNVDDGSVEWIDAGAARTADMVPMIDHWENRIVDVAYNASNSNGGMWSDPSTGTLYGIMSYRLQDQYPEGYNDAKRTGSHVSPATGFGLGTMGAGGADNGWNCTVFYNIDQDGDGDGDNAPVDRLAYVTTGLSSNGNAVEGGIAQLRPDMEILQGQPTGTTTLDTRGAATSAMPDGIPDGDGQPERPDPPGGCPMWRAVRVTVTATPTRSIERMATERSGWRNGRHRLLPPRPRGAVLGCNRQIRCYNQKRTTSAGFDLKLTKTVPVRFATAEPGHRPRSRRWSRRSATPDQPPPVELNLVRARSNSSATRFRMNRTSSPSNPTDKHLAVRPRRRATVLRELT